MSVLSPNPHILYREIHSKAGGAPHHLAKPADTLGFDGSSRSNDWRKRAKRDLIRAHGGFWPELFKPDAVEMEPISDCDHFDQILEHAKENSQPIIVDWMAAWCRKCIYLKPKLEKLAAEYDTKLKFYCVDVNNVPQTLVTRGNISKMPTIQLWKDGEMKAEVIGGHKAWLVIEEVKEMIQQFV